MKTIFFLLFCIKILSFLEFSVSQEVEYYPSNNALNTIISKKDVINHRTIRRQKSIIKNKEKPFWKNRNKEKRFKREVDPVFRGHPKTREEMWNANFLNKSKSFDQNPSLIVLLHNITKKYLNDCIPVILYDASVSLQDSNLLQSLLEEFPVTYVHGKIDKMLNPKIIKPVHECIHFILFLTDLRSFRKVIGMQSTSKVVLVAKTSQWAVQEFLSSPLSRTVVNLLVIGQSFKDDDETLEAPYILYTHKLYVDGLGASKPVVLTSWTHGKFSRNVNLFPIKLAQGYAGHRFMVAAVNQPPFVVKRIQSDLDGGNPRVIWDGIEIRILRLLAQINNFSLEIKEPQDLHLGSGDAVAKEITMGRADVGIAGMYLTTDRIMEMDMSFSHSQDCAAFITLLSTALPRYRAILGPFHWHVWVALTFTYLIGILPLAFSDKHTLSHLLHNSGEIENMFWYVFGTFTNCFTFVGKNSWSRTDKVTTRLLIGWYWIFTIIITSCYTGSIIAFVTLPIFPETIDTIDQMLSGFFKIGTLDRGGWERWFFNSSDPKTNKLLSKMEFLPNVASGIRNTTKSFFWNYAFLGSQAELEYIVQANYSKTKSKRTQLHISDECFVPFGVSFGFPNQSLYTAKLSADIRRMTQSGLVDKIVDEVKWELQRSASGQLLAASSGTLKMATAEGKGLTLEDTQGMFLLLGAGAIIAGAALISEWMGGCNRKCRLRRKTHDKTFPSTNSTENLIPPPNSDGGSHIKVLDSVSGDNIKMFGGSSSLSADSHDTLEGKIIHVSKECITVHRNLDVDDWDSRRSSSADVDKEVKEIFERDKKRRRIQSDGVIDVKDIRRQPTASKGAFGDHVTIA